MQREIKIKEWSKDCGYGKVSVRYDDGLPSNPVIWKDGFNCMREALEWCLEITQRPQDIDDGENAQVAEPVVKKGGENGRSESV